MDANAARRQAEALIGEGLAHIQRGHRKRAAACFRKAWQASGLPTALNNLAALHYEEGNAATALRTLQPILEAPTPMPYTHALASLCHAGLGHDGAAQWQLRLAIADFDEGLKGMRAAGAVEPAWVEYTDIIKRAAGRLGEHRLVLRLHRRWPGQSRTFGLHYAAVAAFNLGEYAQAVRLWGQVRDAGWESVTRLYALVAERLEQGLVPPFALEYEILHPTELQGVNPGAARALLQRGKFRLLALAAAFSGVGSEHEASALTAALIRHTGEWGLDLGQRWVHGATVPRNLKLSAEATLAQMGVCQSRLRPVDAGEGPGPE